MKSLGAMINQLAALVGGGDLTHEERLFLVYVGLRYKRGTQMLTDEQIKIVERIYRKHFGDAE